MHWHRVLMREESSYFSGRVVGNASLGMAWLALLDLYEDAETCFPDHLRELWTDLSGLLTEKEAVALLKRKGTLS